MRMRRGIYVIPSLFTSGNIFCGFYALISAYQGLYFHAALAILIAIILDGLDGKVARMTNASSDFGLEYDSLADVISFGVAPAFLVYTWTLKDLDRLGLLAAFLFAICGALRLARFNVQAIHTPKPDFVGLPIPAAAGLMASGIILAVGRPELDENLRQMFFLVGTYLLAFLMVSTIRYRSFKYLKLRRKKPFQFLVVLVLGILVVASIPEIMIFLIFSGYILSGLVEIVLLPKAFEMGMLLPQRIRDRFRIHR